MFRWNPVNKRLCRTACLVIAVVMLLAAELCAQSDAERLDRYLDRLGLTDLQTAHIEERLTALEAGEERTALARRLADLYAQQLTDSLADASRYEQLSQRVQNLLKLVPEARTAALEVMLLQVDYQRAESLIREWLAEPRRQAARQQASEILQRITPLLHDHHEQLWKKVDEQLAALDSASADVQIAERELTRRQSIAARAAYFAGWSLYYRGILSQPINRGDCGTARQLFQKLLDLQLEEGESYSDFDAEALALESPWRARALVGLGMSEAAIDNVPACFQCFEILDNELAAAEVRDQSDYWCVQGLLLAKHYQPALDFAADQVAGLAGEPTAGKVSFCAALISATNPDRGVDPKVAQQLANIGVRGLARMRQYRLLQELLSKFGVAVDNPEGFLLLWLQGQQRLAQAESSKQAEDFQAAADSLRAALAASDSKNDVAAASHCRQQLAWAYYNLERYVEAIDAYRQSAEGLKAVGDSSAVEAGWMAFVSANRLVDEGEGSATVMHDMANWLNQSFPGHDHSRRAMYLVAKERLRRASPEERLRALRNIAPDDPNFSSARHEICAAAHEQWRDAPDEAKAEAAEQLTQIIAETLATNSLPRLNPSDQLSIRLIGADLAMSSSPPEQSTASRHLSAAASLVGRSGISPEAVAEYHYRALQFARIAGEYDDLIEHARWYLENGGETRFESAALVTAAKGFEEVAAEGGGDGTQSAELGFQLYRRLSELLGTGQQNVGTNRNAQVALSRLAHYAYEIGQREAAAAALEKLLAAFPKDRGYLRRAGLVQFELNQFQTALNHWRTILAGSRAGTEPWYEAKYYQIACLLKVDRKAAAEVFQQLQLLDPQLGPPKWREKFAALQMQL